MHDNAYDVAVIGGGIAGVFSAYFLHQQGKNVVVLDDTLYKKGSMAAGAFIAPKVSKSGPLKHIVNQAFIEAVRFYSNHIPHSFNPCKVEHFLKNDDSTLYGFEDTIDAKQTKNSIWFEQGGIVNAEDTLNFLLKDIPRINMHAKSLKRIDDMWHIDDAIKAHTVVLAQGAHPGVLLDVPYLNIRPIWGQRISISTSQTNNVQHVLHDDISIGCDTHERIIVGATHLQNAPIDTQCTQEAKNQLLKQAQKMVHLHHVDSCKSIGGFRAGSADYLPVVGSLIDHNKTLMEYPRLKNGQKLDTQRCTAYKSIYMLNGLGGRGFVLAPQLARLLVQHIVDPSRDLNENITPVYRFFRWAKKQTK